ncbi:MAG: hypothetical protein M1569_04085 [Candidatus Marsarchaeota archaeon]|nr:hypothetical protein [Candidatus Marsarchaeota archaeon]MCL5413551.1 hypothetical protein [Candidatus Marsarchaeota archaeon]
MQRKTKKIDNRTAAKRGPVTSKKVRASHKKTRATKPKVAVHINAPDIEDFLIGMAMEHGTNQGNGADVENLLYSVTGGMSDLGYRFGFSIGKAIALKSEGKKSFDELFGIIGLGDSLYHPFRDKVIITSRPSILPVFQLKRNIHIYEAGIISGSLSQKANIVVNTIEKQCIYNGSESCQFVSKPMSGRQQPAWIGVDAAADAIAHAIAFRHFSRHDGEYMRALAYLPLIEGNMGKHVLKIMIMSGKKLGGMSGYQDTARIVSSIANYFGAADHHVEKSGRKTLIRLQYESYNSMQGFISLGAALMTGFLESIGMSASVSFITNRDKSYTTIIEARRA